MKNKLTRYFFNYILILLLISCSSKEENSEVKNDNVEKKITLFFVNDQHARLDNFAKIKYIVDKEKETNNVIVACSGDMFSGSPVVDNYKDGQGYPMIDIMNKVGFDISVLGNHEFDYGEATLKERINQANFKWVCANVDMLATDVPQPKEYYTIEKEGLRITFLGLVETNGKDNATIPSTHPWRVKNFAFQRPEDVVGKFKDVKESENSDVFIALTHLGHSVNNGLGDVQLANQFPFFDLIIGGHSHQEINTTENGIPIYQSGSYLKNLGKIELSVKNKKITAINYSLINLDQVTEYDQSLKNSIDNYNNLPDLKEVVGNSVINHEKHKVGCFYADAIKNTMNVDVSFQNSGGVRNSLDQGDITKNEIYTIEPFNNGTVKYEMTIKQIKDFLIGSQSGFYYSGIQITQVGNTVEIKDASGVVMDDTTTVSVGLNDYIPAVHGSYFPVDNTIQALSAAESIIYYLQNINSEVNYPQCGNFFRYSN
ncbi:bifunctional metallophosphatase/5'-nucleotidase [Tenacibaculum insulae]|uniref:bifunctional metallophosphatase/5'-nucleotidase n=1 Tax=Tenacibaculum insulae TaxID=2029677 RepID=UPI003AB55854